MSIVTEDIPCSIAQHVTVALELIALESYRSIVLLAGQHEAPGDTVALIEQHHLRVGQFQHRELGVFILIITGDIGELCVWREEQKHLFAFHIERKACGLRIHDSHEVLTVIRIVFREDRAACIDIHRATLTRIIEVVTVSRERDAVVIDAPVCLILRLSAPPVGTISARFTTAHVTHLRMIDTPGTCNTGIIRCVIHLRVLKGEGFADAALAETVTVAEAQLHVIGASLGIGPVHGVQCRKHFAVDFPDSIGLFRHVGYSEGCLVHRLIDSHIDVHTCHRRQAILIRSVEGLWRAGCQGSCGTAAYQTCTE